MEEEMEIITLEFEDDTTVECEIMGIFEVGGKEYIALLPRDDSDDIYIYGYRELGGDEMELIYIEDDAELDAAVKEFDRIMEED